MKERILITGGAGFIGSHIAESLLEKGFEVIIYDNFSSGKIENLNRIRKHIRIIKADILDYENLVKAMRNVDYVSHQAAQLEIFRCIESPEDDLRINTLGTLNVLKAAVKNGVKKIINASSACVYGQAFYIPQDEDHPKNPNWPYGVSKLAAEKYCQIYATYYGLNVISLRYSIVYGEREWLGRVLTMFIKRILDNKPPVVFGDGRQLRDFIYVKDAVRLHNLCLFGSKANNTVYNVSTGFGTSIRRLAELVIKASGKNLNPVFEDIKEGSRSKYMAYRKRIPSELKKMVLSPNKAEQELKWKPTMKLLDGIKRELDWAHSSPDAWRTNGDINV